MFNWFKKGVKSLINKIPWREVLLIAIGFGFTTFGGNFLASRYQQRLWQEQHNESRKEHEIEVAKETFEGLSSVIDKRIYRMDKLDRWLLDNSDEKMIRKQMQEYREVLYEWNDSYNRNKAVLKIYFGKDIADRFDYMHGFFKETGRTLEEQYYIDPENRDSEQLILIGDRVGDLNRIALELNERMIEKIQAQEVGIFNVHEP